MIRKEGNIMYDVVIIGGGVVGCSIARELSKYELTMCVLEKEEDVCAGTSKANSGIAHAGFDAVPGSFKAILNVKGNQMMDRLSKELDIPFRRNGSIVLCFSEDDIPRLVELKENGEKNGVKGLEIIQGNRIWELEPNITDQAAAALYAPSGGIICPFGLTLAMAENANVNGVEFLFDTQVVSIQKTAEGFLVQTNRGEVKTKILINAAGVFGDVFHNMVSEDKLSIIARKGEYLLMDKKAGNFVDKTIFQLPTTMGKGVLIAPTIHGNLLVGPTAEDIEEKENTSTSMQGLATIIKKAGLSAKNVPLHQVITSFSGLRAHEEGDDFVIGEAKDAEGFFDAIGTESPGLTSAPAIGCMIAEMVSGKLDAHFKQNFNPNRKGIVALAERSKEEIAELIKENPAYGTIVCRCEMVSEGEIIDAIHRPLGAKSLDGIKRRTRAGAGRCQSGFCSPKIIEILARERNVSPLEITKSGKDSKLLTGYNKENSISNLSWCTELSF